MECRMCGCFNLPTMIYDMCVKYMCHDCKAVILVSQYEGLGTEPKFEFLDDKAISWLITCESQTSKHVEQIQVYGLQNMKKKLNQFIADCLANTDTFTGTPYEKLEISASVDPEIYLRHCTSDAAKVETRDFIAEIYGEDNRRFANINITIESF